MSTMTKIKYREFYDVPRVFISWYKGLTFLFESIFDEKSDDYTQHYDIYLMPNLSEKDIEGSWENINSRAKRKICEIPISSIQFDQTLRKEINTLIFEQVGKNEGLW